MMVLRMTSVPVGVTRLTRGAMVSTIQVRLAGVSSTFPAVSAALTRKVWLPLLRLDSEAGEPHAYQEPASSWHRNEPASSIENWKLADWLATVEPSAGPTA